MLCSENTQPIPSQAKQTDMDSSSSHSWRRPHASIERLLRQLVRNRLGPLLRLRGQTRHLSGTIKRNESRLNRLEEQLERTESVLKRPSFEASMTMDQAWNRHPGAPLIFAQHHLPACNDCAVRFDETLAEAAEAYQLDLDALLLQLNALFTAG